MNSDRVFEEFLFGDMSAITIFHFVIRGNGLPPFLLKPSLGTAYAQVFLTGSPSDVDNVAPTLFKASYFKRLI